MGVRDLTSVAKRYAPECITTYSSIRDFKGKTFAIDANLLTTKFHFANAYALDLSSSSSSASPAANELTRAADELKGHRHARAWYHFLRRLRANDIKPIIVFDGLTRLDAKARENERRRLAREVQRLRGEAESSRGERLRNIRAVLASVEEHEREEFVTAFRGAARAILDERERAERVTAAEEEAQELGKDVTARVGAVEEELAKLEQDRRQVRAAIEEFERAVKAAHTKSPAPEPPPPPLASAPPIDYPVSDRVGNAAFPEPSRSPTSGSPNYEAVESDPATAQQESPHPPATPAATSASAAPLASPPLEGESTSTTPQEHQRKQVEEAIAAFEEALKRTLSESQTCESTTLASDQEGVAPSPPAQVSGTAPVSAHEHLLKGKEQDDAAAAPSPAAHAAPSEHLPDATLPRKRPVPSPVSSPVETLASLFKAHLGDATNPIYSRNQIDVFRKEALFFSSLVLAAPAAVSIAAASLAQDVMRVTGSGSAREREGGTSLEPQVEPGEEQAPELTPAGELGTSETAPDAPSPVLSYEEDLHPIIERSSELQRSHDQRAKGISPAAFREVRTLIEALGVPWLQPTPEHPHEAEGVCAALQQHGLADYVVSEDTDVVVYGAPVLRNITLADQPKVPMNVLDPIKLREALGLSKAEFVDFAILLGTDFTERIKGLGPVSALKALRKHRSIDNVLHAESNRFKLNQAFIDAYLSTAQTARDIFLNLPPLPPLDPSSPQTLFSEDSADADASGSGATEVASPTSNPASSPYLGTLQATEPSSILSLLLIKYGISQTQPDADDLLPSISDDAYHDDGDDFEDSLSTWVEEDQDGFDWEEVDDLDAGFDPLAADIPTELEGAPLAGTSDLADSTRPASSTSMPTHLFRSLDTTFERLYL
ncbi:hypothetical protein JCM10908_000514 [Rhodotorula pacifica]|uniref:uncharacterized protein n=1 Tax=Rhodotorula pacifica TaxID=1495444 RepID=UPI0031702760